jgi:hypothetical protein
MYIQRHVQVLLHLLASEEWRGLWEPLQLSVETFRTLGLPRNAPDADIWHLCQERELILITGNRNADGPDSLEVTIRVHNTPTCLPVITVGSTEDILHSRVYAERVVEKLLGYLREIDNYRGTGRL